MINKSRLTLLEGGRDLECEMRRKFELSQQFMSMFPRARLDYYTLAEVEELISVALGLTKENWKNYVEAKVTQVMTQLHDEAAIKIEKLRGLL